MDLTVHQLRCFLSVARELHFGRAAELLRLSPSALSEQITTLERRLSRTLFRRSSRTVELTDHAVELLPLARRAVAAMDEVLEWGSGEAAEPCLRIGLMVSSPTFQTIMTTAGQRMPRVRLRIRQLGFLGCYEALADGDVDCAFVVEIGQTPSPEFDAVPLWDEGSVLVVSEQHRLAERDSVRLAELAGETFVSAEDEAVAARWFSSVVGENRDCRLRPVARTFEEVLELCGARQGVNIAGVSAARTYPRPGVRFVPVVDAPPASTYLYLRRGHHPTALRQFTQLAEEIAGSHPS
ncbi:DNA-binding transcriptional regulator, LysR family [Actinopolyspora xinjiangensis]|uniref:DNA-binding transcriptional regulator, LysR family n=1 Tax=Actinopolyspora xinjiangensis TaxID=405564 RepID=A0A1H0WTW7_9ACTN|nr:LysR family transcriptional regulator [Actinopolyspora xinjiangensis]SDP94082.1 DNA-binding transcriptional regulator, LysR family [Actinopolyspora xinjiangensis]